MILGLQSSNEPNWLIVSYEFSRRGSPPQHPFAEFYRTSIPRICQCRSNQSIRIALVPGCATVKVCETNAPWRTNAPEVYIIIIMTHVNIYICQCILHPWFFDIIFCTCIYFIHDFLTSFFGSGTAAWHQLCIFLAIQHNVPNSQADPEDGWMRWRKTLGD